MRAVRLQSFRPRACPIILIGLLLAPVPRVEAGSSAPPARVERDPLLPPHGATAHRPGYVVGDLIERRAILTVPSGFTLVRTSLPALRRQSGWLRLIRATARDRGGTPHRYEIDLVYQLNNAPLKVREIELPEVHVRFDQSSSGGPGPPAVPSELDRLIEARRITIAPILPPSVPMSASLIRPDHLPGPLSTWPEGLAAALGAGLGGAILAAILAAPALRRRNGPFARAHRRIRRAVARAERTHASTPAACLEALRALHRAFDQTAGWNLFHDRLGAFLAQQRRFADLREAVERFLRMSQREFFECRIGPRSPGEAERERSDLRWLLEFARECRARERQVA